MKEKILVIVVIFFMISIMLMPATATLQSKAENVKNKTVNTNNHDNIKESDLAKKARNFLDNWIESEEIGVKSHQIKETLETLKEYKEKLELEKTPIKIWNRKEISERKELLSDIESEIRWLEYALDFKNYNHNEKVETIQFPASEPLNDPIILYPNNAYGDSGTEGNAGARWDAFCIDPGHDSGIGLTYTDAGFYFGKAWAFSNLWFETTFIENVVATLTFEGNLDYRWIAICLNFFGELFSEADGFLKVSRYIYHVDEEEWTKSEFIDIDAEVLFLWIGFGNDEISYSERLPDHFFKQWNTYCLGVLVESDSRTAWMGRNIVRCDWSLDRILFEPE